MPAELATATDITTFMSAAQQCAPFLFALLFILIITTASHVSYSKVCARKDPPADAEEKHLYELYFKANIWFGMVLVVVAIGWWVYAWRVDRADRIAKDAEVATINDLKKQVSYRYQFSVLNSHPDIAQISSSFPRITTSPGSNVQLDIFLVEQPEPFQPNAEFDLQLSIRDAAYVDCIKSNHGQACPPAPSAIKVIHVPYRETRDTAAVTFNLNVDQGTLDPMVAQLPQELRAVAAAWLRQPGGGT